MSELVFIWGSFFLAGIGFWIWELAAPARPVEYAREIPSGLGAFAIVFCFFLIIGGVARVVAPPERLAAFGASLGVADLPIAIRVACFYLVWDCTMYWAHRLMHAELLWRTHRWHHAPSNVWWLVGVRGSLPHIALTYPPFLWFWVFDLPAQLAIVASVSSVVGNVWMHVNIDGRWMRWVEMLLVTPRFHVIHHGLGPEHHRANFGSLFTLWDRLFGTYVDPDAVDRKSLRFGIVEPASVLRLAAGV